MTNKKRLELIDKIKNVDLDEFSMHLTNDGKLNINLNNSYINTLLNPNKQYLNKIKDLVSDFNVDEYVKYNIDDICVNDEYEIFEKMGINEVLEDLEYEVYDKFQHDLQKYLNLSNDEFKEFTCSISNMEYKDVYINETEICPEYINDIIILNVSEINEVLDKVDEAMQENKQINNKHVL